MPRKKPGATASMAEGTKAKKAKPAAKAPKKPRSGSKAKAAPKVSKMANPAPTVTEKHPGGRPTDYIPQYAHVARLMCANGATDAELANAFGVTTVTIWRWQSKHTEFCNALKVSKGEYDARVERSLAQRAIGYSYDAVKIFMPSGAEAPIYAPYAEHVPPDPGAAKIWLCNRQPDQWRDRKELTGADGTPLVPILNVQYGSVS